MPVREPKGRYMRREYFDDHEFQTTLTAEQREFYMGVAMFADDSGWLRWEPQYIGSFIYRYQDHRKARDKTEKNTRKLEETGRLKMAECGLHAQLPRASGKRAGEHEERIKKEHIASCLAVDTSRLETTRDDSSTLPYLTSPHLTSAPARAQGGAPGDTETFGQIMARQGYHPDPKKS